MSEPQPQRYAPLRASSVMRLIRTFISDECGASRIEGPPIVRAGLIGLLLLVVVAGLTHVV
ncbi:hypothetical protein [Phenylobacterium immobile]|uniref:hypothetical protein n=1 Tax=Phenylobacterium immobile TaxID=21 RepID=UPI000AFD85B9|nr:hypothetical protein [Phenylobacterium immobile]